METFYASPERSLPSDILSNYNFIKNQPDITSLLDALPNFVMILDENRQIVYLNSSLHSYFAIDVESSLGKRPGELINCIYSGEMKWGCGTTKNCRFCGMVNSILESQVSENIVTKDCRVISTKGDFWTNYEFSVSSSKFKIDDKFFTLFTLTDISDKKRRLILEKIFFHDLINSAGSLDGVLNLLREYAKDENQQNLINIASNVSKELIEEVLSQRQILEAENDELITDLKPCNSSSLLNTIVTRMTNHSVSAEKKIQIDEDSVDVDFISDIKILKRILINMVKNALEAINKGEAVRIKAEIKGNSIIFSTNNPNYIPDDIQLQIFQRSFSTKGSDRGLGTYSMKLLAEKYLNGKVYFKSHIKKGTTFYCELPMV